MVRVIAALGAALICLLFSQEFGARSAAHAQPAASHPNYNTAPLPPNADGMESDAPALAARITLGWNLGNTLEATGGETAWGNPRATRALLHLVKQSGFDAVRLPVAWNFHADGETALIDPAWMARVREVIQYCLDEDLYVLVNTHWDGGWLERHVDPASANDVSARQRAFWQQIATALRDYDEHVMFASANEPAVDNAEQMAVLDHYHQTFVDAVRETGGRNAFRVLVVQGPSTDIEKTDRLWTAMPRDTMPNRLMLEVHYYTPWNFTGMEHDESWGRPFYYWGRDHHSVSDAAHNPTWGEEDAADALFARMKRNFVDEGVPVIIGEFGAIRRDHLTGDALALHLASRAHYFEYVASAARANEMVPFFWDNGSGVFDRRAVRVSDQAALDALHAGVAAP